MSLEEEFHVFSSLVEEELEDVNEDIDDLGEDIECMARDVRETNNLVIRMAAEQGIE
jgi:frataxin-like iron-binding protein CyaY